MKLLLKLLQLIILVAFISNNAIAQSIPLIRDSQTEDFLNKITLPLIEAANLRNEDIKIYIVNYTSLNAFVMGGQNIFINTGLITKYQDPSILTGVIAHEMGHIAGGHLARGHESRKDIGKVAILSYLAGIAAAIAADGDAGYAILMGSNHVAQRLAVHHTRMQEESADRLALKYLEKVNKSPIGLMKLLQYFNQEESEYKNVIDEYALTHPVSQKRINYIKANLKNFKDSSSFDEGLVRDMKYVVAKLIAFLQEGDKTLRNYNSNSSIDRYARSIAYFKRGKIKQSLSELDELIRRQPANGYFHELKGQFLFESGMVAQSIKAYKKAINFLPNADLAKISISSAILSLETSDQELINFAIRSLNEANIGEKDNSQIFRELAKAYLKINNKGRSYLALAELNVLRRDDKKARKYAKQALDHLDSEDKSSIIKAKDILVIIKEELPGVADKDL